MSKEKHVFKRGDDVKYQDTLRCKKELEALGWALVGEEKKPAGKPAKPKKEEKK